MNPGRLGNRITFQTKMKTEGPITNLDDYQDYKTVWCEINFLRGRNLYAARASNIKTDAEFLIRRRKDLNEKMRIKLIENGTNRHFEVESILPFEKDRMFLIVSAHEIKYDM